MVDREQRRAEVRTLAYEPPAAAVTCQPGCCGRATLSNQEQTVARFARPALA